MNLLQFTEDERKFLAEKKVEIEDKLKEGEDEETSEPATKEEVKEDEEGDREIPAGPAEGTPSAV